MGVAPRAKHSSNDELGLGEYLVQQADSGYSIQYSIGARIPVPTSIIRGDNSTTTNTTISYQDIQLTGTVLCEAGAEPVNIFKSTSDVLALKVTEQEP